MSRELHIDGVDGTLPFFICLFDSRSVFDLESFQRCPNRIDSLACQTIVVR